MNRDLSGNRRLEPRLPGVVEHGRVERLTRDASAGSAPECFCHVNIVWSTFLSTPKDVTRQQR